MKKGWQRNATSFASLLKPRDFCTVSFGVVEIFECISLSRYTHSFCLLFANKETHYTGCKRWLFTFAISLDKYKRWRYEMEKNLHKQHKKMKALQKSDYEKVLFVFNFFFFFVSVCVSMDFLFVKKKIFQFVCLLVWPEKLSLTNFSFDFSRFVLSCNSVNCKKIRHFHCVFV